MNKLWQIVMVSVWVGAWVAPAGAEPNAAGNANVPRVTTVPAPLPLPMPVTAEASPPKVNAPKAAATPVVPPVAKPKPAAAAVAPPTAPADAAREAVPAPVAPSLAAHGLPVPAGRDKPQRKAPEPAGVAESVKPKPPATPTLPRATSGAHKKGAHKAASRTSAAAPKPTPEPILRESDEASLKAGKHGKAAKHHAAKAAASPATQPHAALKAKPAVTAGKHRGAKHRAGKAVAAPPPKPAHQARKRLNDGSHP